MVYYTWIFFSFPAGEKVFLPFSAALAHLAAAAVTEYTVNNREQVPAWFNYAWHVVFLLGVPSFQELYAEADAALYRTKCHGKNGIYFAEV